MKIETLEDWNSILEGCGCCPMPVCPVPERECESIAVNICGFSLPACEDISKEDQCRRFASRKDSYTLSEAINGILSNSERWDMTWSSNASTIWKKDENCAEYADSGTRYWSYVRSVEDQIYNEETEEYEFQKIYPENYSETSFFDQENSCSGTYSVSQDFVSGENPTHVVN